MTLQQCHSTQDCAYTRDKFHRWRRCWWLESRLEPGTSQLLELAHLEPTAHLRARPSRSRRRINSEGHLAHEAIESSCSCANSICRLKCLQNATPTYTIPVPRVVAMHNHQYRERRESVCIPYFTWLPTRPSRVPT